VGFRKRGSAWFTRQAKKTNPTEIRRRFRSGFPVFRFSGFPVFRFSGFPVFRFSGFPVFRFSGFPVFR
jgi:hypothetical protein